MAGDAEGGLIMNAGLTTTTRGEVCSVTGDAALSETDAQKFVDVVGDSENDVVELLRARICPTCTNPVQLVDDTLVYRVAVYGVVPPDQDSVTFVIWPESIGDVAVNDWTARAGLVVTRSVAERTLGAGVPFELSATV